MGIRWIATLLCALTGVVAVPLSVNAEPETDTMAGPPELGVAVVVDGRFVEVRRFVKRMVIRTGTADVSPGVKIEVKAGTMGPASNTEVVPVVETHITRIDATKVVAQRIDGRAVSFKVLVDELARPTPVVLATQGQQVEPLFSKLFKPESLLLVLPSSATPPPTVFPNSTAPGSRPR
jgi:hypothetical protein